MGKFLKSELERIKFMEYIKSIFKEITKNAPYYINLLLQHLKISVFSIVIAVILGVAIGVFIFYNKKIRSLVLGITNGIYTIPSIAVLGLLIPLVGIGFWNASVTLIIYGLLPVIRNTYTGLENIDKKIIEISKGMGATELQTFKNIRLPLALPIIVSGIRTVVIMTISLAGIASFIGAGGLGQAIYRGINTNNSVLIVIGSLLIAILAIILDCFLNIIEKKAFKKINGYHEPKRKQAKKIMLILGTGFVAVLLFMVFNKTFISKSSGANRKVITIATKPSAEQLILGEMASILIEENTKLHIGVSPTLPTKPPLRL